MVHIYYVCCVSVNRRSSKLSKQTPLFSYLTLTTLRISSANPIGYYSISHTIFTQFLHRVEVLLCNIKPYENCSGGHA
jgi:hypothetical protein